jgi:CHAT domain-containing protein
MLLFQPPEATEYKLDDFPSYAEQFLLNRYSIVYSPTTWLSQQESDLVSKNPNVLVLANPFDSKPRPAQDNLLLSSRAGWRSSILWFAENEADSIEKIYPRTKVYRRNKATKGVFEQEAQNHQLLHFATHAFVDTVFAAFSGLVLATTDDTLDDGLLMGYEIADLYLDADLVTLSACETGRGEKVAGEGVLGLPRLFLGAGAKQVLMTLWKVDDKFTSELMPKFYDNYLNGKLSKAEALSFAKRDILRKPVKQNGVYYEHPFYWASFTLYGDPGKKGGSLGSFLILAISLTLATTILGIIFLFKVGRKKPGFIK